MANSYYQTITKPKLYVSYPLWQYANGALDDIETNYNISDGDTYVAPDQDLIRMIQLDPSKITKLYPDDNQPFSVNKYKILPKEDNFTNVIDSGLWNFDYMAILGHNFASANAKVVIQAADANGSVLDIETSNIVNHNPHGVCEFDGWSLFNLDTKPQNNSHNFRFCFTNNGQGSYGELPLKVGSIMWGKVYEFPQNADLSETISFDYGITQKKTISGKTISQANFTKPNNWITEPFGLTEATVGERGDNFQRRSGIRTWDISFDSLAPEKVMNQLIMMNSNGWTAQENHSHHGENNESDYNINNGIDFYTNIVNRSINGHLPMMLQIDADDPSPQNFAIVRMDSKSFKITQKTPNLYNIKLKLTEQI